jgi:hypothetical protein
VPGGGFEPPPGTALPNNRSIRLSVLHRIE